jgi:hypothetical protein
MAEEDQGLTYEGYMEQTSHSVDAFVERTKQATSLFDLRTVWDEGGEIGRGLGTVSETQFKGMMASIREKLTTMGLDFSVADDRLQMFLACERDMKTAMRAGIKLDTYDVGMHSEALNAYYRILTACDIQSPDRLQLLPIESLLPVDYTAALSDVGLSYTDDEQYTIPHRFPRKASHRVTDVRSPFWGCDIFTDTWPGYRHENMYLWIPSGRVNNQALAAGSRKSNGERYTAEHPLYMPKDILVQGLQLGERDRSMIQIDTSSGFVGKFLESVKQEIRTRT